MTVTVSVSPICMATAVGLEMADAALSCVSLIAKAEEASETVTSTDAATTPAALAVTIVVPAAAPAIETEKLPLLFVILGAVKVTAPVPDWVSVTGIPEIGLPPASKAEKTTDAESEPSAVTVRVVGLAVSFDPSISIDKLAVTFSAVAVMVAVRLVWLVVPEEKVKVAWPWVSVATAGALKVPVSAVKVTIAPGTIVFEASSTVTVIVAEVESPDLTVMAGVTTSESEATLEVAPLPQPATRASAVANNSHKVIFGIS